MCNGPLLQKRPTNLSRETLRDRTSALSRYELELQAVFVPARMEEKLRILDTLPALWVHKQPCLDVLHITVAVEPHPQSTLVAARVEKELDVCARNAARGVHEQPRLNMLEAAVPVQAEQETRLACPCVQQQLNVRRGDASRGVN